MEVSKLKLELYDLAAIILPGIFLLAELVALLKGFPQLFMYLRAIRGAELTLLLLCSFALGNLVQEAGDRLIKRYKGHRFFRQGRDRFWTSEHKKDVCAKIIEQGGPIMRSVDAAFDFCLTCLGNGFAKRDIFLAISDLSRSLWVLSLLAILPLARSVVYAYGWKAQFTLGAEGLAFIAIAAWLSWERMVRFRELSETPVFHAFLAGSSKAKGTNSEASEAE
jgi:hypothetical protein